MDELLALLQRLPKAPRSCQVGIVSLPSEVRADDGELIQPHFPVWVDVESGTRYADPESVVDCKTDGYSAVLDTFEGFLASATRARFCPRRIEVRDPDLAEYLRRRLEGAGLEVALTDRLDSFDAAAKELLDYFVQNAKDLPSLLEARGATIERIRAFAEAAAAFHRAAPWRWLSDVDLIEVESPKPPRGMTCFVVLGAGGDMYGLGIYASRRDFLKFIRAGMNDNLRQLSRFRLAQVSFERLEDSYPPDAALWTEHQLPVAGEGAYPSVVKFDPAQGPSRPSVKELAFLEAVMRAMADTTEAEIDSGRWSKEAATSEGPQTLTLRIPDLLDPPSARDWIARGFAPDRRSTERIHADIQRYVDQLPPGDLQDPNVVARLYAGRSLDDPVTQPRTSEERAQDLCFQAFESHGRRRIQLARQALELDPDCADAYVVLAENSSSLQDRLEYYRRGVEAGERALGPKSFEEDAGLFWKIARTRPYMRARQGLAESLADAGRPDEAIEHFRELLRLNPEDNQGIRFQYLASLLAAGRNAEAARALKEFEDDSAHAAYTRVLLAYRLSGPSASAARELHEALSVNPYAAEFLDGPSRPPAPSRYAPGDEDEGRLVAGDLWDAFQGTPGVLDWMNDECRRLARSELVQRQQERRKLRAEKKKKRKRR
jgi:tetratricopeptide (TPR) repeat protein